MSELKLELGKKYVCRNRDDIKYASITYYYDGHNYPFWAYIYFRNGSVTSSGYTKDGRYDREQTTGLDLIAEYVEKEEEPELYGSAPTNYILNKAEENKDEARRFNKDKIALTMYSPIALIGTCRVLTYGKKKYSTPDYDARDNWRKGSGLSFTETIDSLLRHITLLLAGQERDEESGELHVDHIGANTMFLQEMVHLKRYKDDKRYITTEQMSKLQELLSKPVKDYNK